jgi:hypothetical protein
VPKKLGVRLKEAAAKVVEKFTGFPPVKAARLRLKTRQLGKYQATLGRVAYIGYVSDKWDKKPRLYHHDFSGGPILAFDPQTKLLVIWPAGWKISSRGIVG